MNAKKMTTHEEGVAVSGKWIWKDDPVTPALEFVRTSSSIQRGGGLSRGGETIHIFSKSALSKREQHEHTTVTLEDIKKVALEEMSETHPIPAHLENLFRKEQFDSFIIHLLNYFNSFFNKMSLESRKNPMYIEPSLAEKIEYANACERLSRAQKLLGGAYSLLLLGLEAEKQHHTKCGRSRVSKTHTDRSMFETFYKFCTFVVWITFRRKEFDCVKKEIGRLLRSDTFNPALRVRNTPAKANEVNPVKVKKEGKTAGEMKIHCPVNSLTLAEYRRLYQTRPAIKSIINQRSPAIMSILPSPKEEAYWLFAHPKLQNDGSYCSTQRDDAGGCTDGSYSHLTLDVSKFRAGILGEPYKLFNPQTLSPLAAETENEEEDGEIGMSEVEGDIEEENLSSGPGISRQQTAISHVTTEAFTDDET